MVTPPRASTHGAEQRGVVGPPLLPEVGVVALVQERFDSTWMSRHQVLVRLARWFHVVWMNPALEWRQVLRDRPWRGEQVRPPRSGGLVALDPPPWLPIFYKPLWLGRATEAARLRRARKELFGRGADRIALHTWRPKFRPALDRIDYDSCIYHIIDDYSYSDTRLPMPVNERELIELADAVIVHSPGLLERKGGINPRTYQIPNGVDFSTAEAKQSEPLDLKGVPRPRIGYCGWLKKQLDWDLLQSLAERHPDWSFVFVGAITPFHAELPEVLERLDRLPNVHLLGAKQSHELLQYPGHFDVCMMPYRMTAYTNCIYPLKLHEYLATGTPIVGTPIRTLRDFEQTVALAEGVDAWSEQIRRILEQRPEDEEVVSRRVDLARAHDWDAITLRVARVIAGSLGPEVSERFDSIAAQTSSAAPSGIHAPRESP